MYILLELRTGTRDDKIGQKPKIGGSNTIIGEKKIQFWTLSVYPSLTLSLYIVYLYIDYMTLVLRLDRFKSSARFHLVLITYFKATKNKSGKPYLDNKIKILFPKAFLVSLSLAKQY